MRRIVRLVTVLLLFALSACIAAMPTQSGRPIDPEFVKGIARGKTTMEEVRTRLGAPLSVTESQDTQQWIYQYWEGKPAMFGYRYEKSKTQMLMVRFRDGKVIDYSLSTTAQ